jgi:hypothetical protein
MKIIFKDWKVKLESTWKGLENDTKMFNFKLKLDLDGYENIQ